MTVTETVTVTVTLTMTATVTMTMTLTTTMTMPNYDYDDHYDSSCDCYLCRRVAVCTRRTLVKDAMRELKYRGPPLLFTMHLCLGGVRA